MRKVLLIVLLLLLGGFGFWWWQNRNKAIPGDNSFQNSTQPPTTNNQISAFDKTKYSLSDPGSIWAVINKKRSIPSEYKPSDLMVPNVRLRLGSGHEQMQLRAEAGKALEEMFGNAKTSGYDLMLGSGFRSYALQKSFYNGYVAQDGVAGADRYSARPGHSEHQTGLAVDIDRADQRCHLEECFGQLPEGQWLAEHAYKYGFILRYTADKEPITGYQYEPWHFRYVGKELAAEMNKQGITTLEEFFNLPAAFSY